MLIARGMRCTVRVSSTSCLNPSFSSMVATGNKPPYGVRFLPEKSKGVLAAILLGSDPTFGEPCGTDVLRVCLELSFTIWVTPGNGLAKGQTSLPFCSTTAFSGSPNGFFFSHAPHAHQNSCIDQVECQQSGSPGTFNPAVKNNPTSQQGRLLEGLTGIFHEASRQVSAKEVALALFSFWRS